MYAYHEHVSGDKRNVDGNSLLIIKLTLQKSYGNLWNGEQEWKEIHNLKHMNLKNEFKK